MREHDLVVVGGGIVGLATARELLRRFPGADVVVLEKEVEVARHQSGHNSGVVHAGIYYTPGSLKARLCQAGATATREFCARHGIELRTPGKLIVATTPVELVRMEALLERGRANGLTLERIDAGELRRREPNVTGLGAIWLAATGIVDYRQVCQAMAAEIRAAGGRVRLGARVRGLRERAEWVEVSIDSGSGAPGESGGSRDSGKSGGSGEVLRGRRVLGCAGLQADRLARMSGLGEDFRIVPFRGEYYHLPPSRAGLVSAMIYPVPDPDLPFLGVHLTPTIDGRITVGPNAVLGWSREGYRKGSVRLGDVADFVRFPGLWRFARGQLRTGLREMRDSLLKRGYLERVRAYCPELRVDDLQPYEAGIRAQAVMSDGSLAEDFLIRRTDRTVHVCNAPSPAATSAMPIAEYLADRFDR